MIESVERKAWQSGSRSAPRGVTLVELLVVISILSFVTVLVVPQIRTISKERSLREAARVVGSVFVEAADKARAEGFAGVAIERNPRILRHVTGSGTDVIYYAGYSLYQMRSTAPYIGNTVADQAQVVSPSIAVIPAPFDSSVVIERNNYLQLGDSPNRYLVTNVAPGIATDPPNSLRLTFATQNYQSAGPMVGSAVDFKVWRRPRVVESSRIDLPRGYFINLNYSGHMMDAIAAGNDYTWTTLTLTGDAFPAAPVVILFGSHGGIDRILPYGFGDATTGGGSYRPHSSLKLCVAPDDFKHSFSQVAAPFRPMPQSFYVDGTDLMNDPSLMWVTVDQATGATNVAASSPPATPLPAVGPYFNAQTLRILEATRIAGKRQIAEQ